MTTEKSNVTPALAAEMGLSVEEFARVESILGRTPNLTELGVFSAMWSEHCSYKSSKVWLKTLPTEGPRVICGPGENAGVVDIGDGDAVVFKIESHNHPSFIEPYQGAATGVGGILRDVFTMGARPVALLNSLRFGDPSHPKTRHLVGGVVAGIGGYGNCVGVPTVGGEVQFHSSYNGNILVNAMCVGIARADRIFYSAASGAGNPVIYVGAKTGRDGIHGATMASAEFDDTAAEKRPTVQVGDPFTEKLLIESCLELMAGDTIVAIQDMGAAGLTSSAVEMAGKGGLGIELDLDKVPMRETGMIPYEIMLSESQERMLMVLRPGSEDAARRVFEKWELDFAVIGHVTDTGRLILKMHGEIAADIPVGPLVTEAPLYHRPTQPRPKPADIDATTLPARDPLTCLKRLLACPDLASKRWVWEQYDHLVMGNTVKRPGGDAAVVRVDDAGKALALCTDCTPRYCRADPERGGMQAVAESWRNLCAVGALPLALTDNMNFGNPEKPEIMAEFAGACAGMRAACLALDYPVVSGNVSLYNETSGSAIWPAPVIGGVGLIADAAKAVDLALKRDGNALILIGETANAQGGHLGASLYLREIEGREDGAPPPVDLAAERRHGDFVRDLVEKELIAACHDISDGGLLVAVAEMAMAGGNGIALDWVLPEEATNGWFFGEDQGRYLIETHADLAVSALATELGVPIKRIGTVKAPDRAFSNASSATNEGIYAQGKGTMSGAALTLPDGGAISVIELKAANESWLPAYMACG